MVGARGFEPPTPWSRTRCATRLRYAPNIHCDKMPMNGAFHEAQAWVGLLDRCTDLCSLADIAAGMATGLPDGLPRGRRAKITRINEGFCLDNCEDFVEPEKWTKL
jgi:hypothetical protein